MVVNYQHIPPVSETASTGPGGLVAFQPFTVQRDGHQQGARVSVSVTIGSGAQLSSCSTSFIDDA
jgi:hypothetical protein